MHLTYTAIATIFLAGATSAAGIANAQSYSGTTVGGQTWERPELGDECCYPSPATGITYSDQVFYVDVAGAYDLTSDQSYDGVIYLYADSFDPLQNTVNLVAGNDDGAFLFGPSEIDSVSLDANRTYVFVTTGWRADDEGTFTNTVSGPGTATFTAALVENIEQLAAAAGVTGRIVVVDARKLIHGRAADSFAMRDAGEVFTVTTDPETGAPVVSRATQSQPGMAGNLYTWVDATGFRAEDKGSNRIYRGFGLQAGADLALNQDTLVGLSLGVQDVHATVPSFSQEGTLTYLQPYLAHRSGAWSGEASLVLGHGEYTQSTNSGTGQGETRLGAVTVTGAYDITVNDAVTIAPVVGFAHGSERVKGTGGILDGATQQTVRFTQASIGTEITHMIGGGAVFAGLHADWLHATGDSTLVSDLLVDNGWTGRVEIGLNPELASGQSFEAALALSGLGGDLQSTTGSLRFALKF